MFNDNNLVLTLFFNDKQRQNHAGPFQKVIINNEANKQHLINFLGKIYTPLRFSYIFDIKILTTFVKIIKFFDLPYRFDINQNNLWRYHARPYGTFFDKKKRSFVSFFSMGFKKNIGVLIPFILNYPSKSNLLHVVDWHKFSFLFENTLNKKYINFDYTQNLFISKTLYPTKDFYAKLIAISPHIFSKRFHRSLNLSDIDIDPWLTTSDFRFWTFDIYDSRYKKSNLAKLDFSWGVHNSFISSSFFITSFDTNIILYPELYFKYLNKKSNQSRFFQFKHILKKKYNKSFFFSIINLFLSYYQNKFSNEINKFTLSLYNNNNNNYYYLKLIYFFLLFNQIFYNKIFKISLKNLLFLYKPSKIKNSLLIKNYYYSRTRKYRNKSRLLLFFKLNYTKKMPRNNRYNKYVSTSSFVIQNIFRSFYSNYYFHFLSKIKSFWNYFFTFFLQNIKRRFLYFDYDNNYIYDILLFLKKFTYFNNFLKNYLNSFNYTKKFKKYFNIIKIYKNSNLLINNKFLNYNDYINYMLKKKVKNILFHKFVKYNKSPFLQKSINLKVTPFNFNFINHI